MILKFKGNDELSMPLIGTVVYYVDLSHKTVLPIRLQVCVIEWHWLTGVVSVTAINRRNDKKYTFNWSGTDGTTQSNVFLSEEKAMEFINGLRKQT